MPELVCVGLSYQTARLDIRERAQLSTSQQEQILSSRAALPGVDELVCLSTCNRTELYAFGTVALAGQTLQTILIQHSELSDLPLYTFTGQACIDHLMRVVSGLDSQVIGESQILGQATSAYRQSIAQHAIGPMLSTLMQHAIRTGKRVRHETGLSHGALSISAVAAKLASTVAGSLDKATVLVIGAGEMARLSALSFARRNVGQLWIANRTLDHAQALAIQACGKAIPFETLKDAILHADIVITATAAQQPLIDSAMLENLSGRSLLIFDIGLPRNVASEVEALPGIQLYNLDSLQAAADLHRAERENAIPQAEAIIQEAIEAFQAWQETRFVVPIIQELRARAEKVWRDEFERTLQRSPNLTERDRRWLEISSQRRIKQMLHQPIMMIKQRCAERNTEPYANMVNELLSHWDQVPV